MEKDVELYMYDWRFASWRSALGHALKSLVVHVAVPMGLTAVLALATFFFGGKNDEPEEERAVHQQLLVDTIVGPLPRE